MNAITRTALFFAALLVAAPAMATPRSVTSAGTPTSTTSTSSATTPPTTPATPAVCEPSIEVYDGKDNDCDGEVDEGMDDVQTAAYIDDLVASCPCKGDITTIGGVRERDFISTVTTAAEDIKLNVSTIRWSKLCDDATANGATWNGHWWDRKSYQVTVQTGQRLDYLEGMTGLLADTMATMNQGQTEKWAAHDADEAAYRAAQKETDEAQNADISVLYDEIYDTYTDSDGDGKVDTHHPGLKRRVVSLERTVDGYSYDDDGDPNTPPIRVPGNTDAIRALEATNHGSVGATFVVGAQDQVEDEDGNVLRPGNMLGVGVTASGFGAPFMSAPWLRVGAEITGAVLPAERGLSLLPNAMFGYHGQRFGAYGLVGCYVGTAGTAGRESAVVSFGIDGGVRGEYQLVDGLVAEAWVLVGHGLRSASDGDRQDVSGSGQTVGGAGLKFVF